MLFMKLAGVVLVLALDYVYGKVVSGSFSDGIGFANNVVDEQSVQKDRKIRPAETVKSDSRPTSSPSIAPETDAVLLKAKINKFVLVPIQVVNGKRRIISNIKQYPALDDKPNRRRASFPVFKKKKKDMKEPSHEKKQRRYYRKSNDDLITVVMQKGNVTFSKDDLDIKPIDDSPVFNLPLFVKVYGSKKYSREKDIDAIIKANLDAILTEHVKKQNMILTSMIMDQSNDRDIRVVDNNDVLLNDLLSIPSKTKEDSNAVHIRQKRIRRSYVKNSTI